jgi:hypothetical protein
MQIRLTDGVTMWFLGDPKNLLVNLNFVNRGPAEVDFIKLSSNDQNRIINAIKCGQLQSDITVEDLISLQRKPDMVTITHPVSTISEPTTITVTSGPPQIINSLEFLKNEMETKRLERCQTILRRTVRSIKVAVSADNDITLIKLLIKMEESNKARKSVLTFLREKLQILENVVVKFSEKEKVGVEKQTEEYNVIESDEKVISLSPEELIQAGYQI